MEYKPVLSLTCLVAFLSFISTAAAQEPPAPRLIPLPPPFRLPEVELSNGTRVLPPPLPTAVPPVGGRRVLPPISLPPLPQISLPPLPRLALPPLPFAGRTPSTSSPGPASDVTSINGVPPGSSRTGAPVSPDALVIPLPPNPLPTFPVDAPVLPPVAVFVAEAPAPRPGPELVVSTALTSGGAPLISGALSVISAALVALATISLV